ncbi:hypothetical protein O7627_29630 [Solwaraspora sp. WMMD1047]|uniref:hypothetical protein n=1 Tax=Solwaraspora sp. WMMD1047 TaxID=3016102 RepID=UPI0024172330|nr:hypothetical protein [Solwaraspora sp. WMMD1047]MDG4833437.1 hypothetical protein [Solwaraspora sp. WMMD1047]
MGTTDDEPSPGPERGRRRPWTPINGRRIGGHFDTPGRPRLEWIDTGSGAGIEVTPEDADLYRWRIPPFPTGTLSGGWGPPMGLGGCLESGNETPRIIPDYINPDRPAPPVGPDNGPAVMPNAIPPGAQADTLRQLLQLHEPRDENTCQCGLLLGEETGLCWYGRRAQRALFELTLDHRSEDPDDPDV